MALNWKEINLLIGSLDLEHFLIQKVYQPDFSSLVFELHKKGKSSVLFLSLKQGNSVFFFRDRKPASSLKLQRFAQLLRSRITGSRISEITQIGTSRLIRITMQIHDEILFLYLVFRGNTTNALLCSADNIILDTFYRRPGQGFVSGSYFDPELLAGSNNEKEFSVRPYPGNMNFADFIASNWENDHNAEKTESLQKQAEKIYHSRGAALQSRLEKLEKELNKADNFQACKECGDILLANQNSVPSGSTSVTLHNYISDRDITISLDPLLTVVENAEKYYRKYKKAKTGIAHLRLDKNETLQNLAALNAEYESVVSGNSADMFSAFIKKEQHSAPVRTGKEIPGIQCVSHGFLFYVGRNARENDHLMRKYVRGNDYWLHARDYPGGYVFIKYKSAGTVPLPVLLDAALLALHFSKGKGNSNADIYCTQVKYLRRAKHGVLGTVIPTREKNLTVSYDAEKVRKLLEQD